VFEGPLDRVPISLERIDADFTRVLRYIRVENLGQKVTLWCTLRESTFNNEFAPENATFVGCLDWSNDVCLDISDVSILVLVEDDAIRWVLHQVELLLG